MKEKKQKTRRNSYTIFGIAVPEGNIEGLETYTS